MPHSLFDDFKEAGYHSSILSTFSVDPAFYDASLQLRLRGMGCQNNLLIADATMLDQALETIPEAFPNAGRKYLVAPIATTACFHPKLALRYGKAKARLIVGSANVTAAGWAGNLELVSALTWQARDEDGDNHINRTLIVRAHHWLSALLEPDEDSKIAYKLELLRSQSPWIEDTSVEGDGPFQLADGSLIDLLLSTPSDAVGLGDRMLGLVVEPVERLTIISPYWDESLSALKRLISEVGNPDLRIFLSLNSSNPSRSSTFPVTALGDLSPKFHPIVAASDMTNRFLHAKMFLFHGRDHDFLFLGSANCTVAALGVPGKPGTNHECLLYRKLPRGTVTEMLNLSFKTRIAVAEITAPPEKSSISADSMAFGAGSVERNATTLFWLPASNIPAQPTSIIVGDLALPLSRRADGVWIATIGNEKLESNIARICLKDGRTSRPMLIASPEELKRFAPFPIADSLRRKLDAVLNGDADLIGLAKDIHLLLEDDEKAGASLERARGAAGRNTAPTVAGRDFASADEFRKALNLRASMKSAGLAHGENPALQALLQIVLRGMVNIDSVAALDAADAESAKGDNVGEDQDDVGQSDDKTAPPQQNSARDIPAQIVTPSEFQRNQAALWRGIGQFQNFLVRAKAADAQLDLNFVTRSLFMLYLMLHGCTKQYRIKDGETKVLIPFAGGPRENFRDSFLFVAAQAIAGIWGPNFSRSLVGRLRLTMDSDTLPIPITTLTVISRWVLAAILSEVRSAKAHKTLRPILEQQVPGLFDATRVFPELGQEEMSAMIGHMEQNIGMDMDQAARIRATLWQLNGLPATSVKVS
jgi:hypothetical protein